MSDVKNWFRTNTANNAASPDGWAEGMLRSNVNDVGRETHASIKRFYDDPGYRQPLLDYSFTGTGTSFLVSDGTHESNAANHLAVGQAIKIVGTGADAGTTFVGWLTVVNYVAPNTGVVVEWILPASTPGPTAVQPASAYWFHDKELGKAAFSSTGTTTGQTPGQIPTIDDLEPHVTKPENTLDVGFLEGKTANDISVSAHHGRINFNGDFSIWQRGTSFTGSTPFGNSDGDLSADGWVILSDGADQVDVSKETGAVLTPSNFNQSIRMEAQATGSAVRHGLAFMIEAEDAFDVTGPNGANNKVSLSFYAAEDPANTGVNAVRAYLLRQTAGPATDPVGGWPSAGADLSPSANWQIIASASQAITTTPTRYEPAALQNLDPDPSGVGTGVLAIVITPDVTPATGQVWSLAGVQLNHGPEAMPFVHSPRAMELARAERYCESTFDDGVTPAHNQGAAQALAAWSNNHGDMVVDWRFAMPKYKTPTLVTYNPGDAAPATGNWEDSASVDRAVDSTAVSTKGAHITCVTASNHLLHHIAAYVHANIWGNN